MRRYVNVEIFISEVTEAHPAVVTGPKREYQI